MPTLWPHQTLGAAHSTPILFLHGFLGSRLDWLPAARALAGDYFCILADLPGHGEHGLPIDSEPLSFERTTEDLLYLIGQLGIPAPTLVGYSLGGRLALHFACSHPDKTDALALESASPGIGDPAERAARAALDDRRAAQLLSGGLPAFLENWYCAGLWRSLQGRPELLADLKSTRAGGDPHGLARALAELSPGRMPPLWDCLPGLHVPVLLLAGEFDEIYTAHAARMGERIPDSRVAVIPSAGHNVHLEQPEKFLEKLRVFANGAP